MNDWKFSIATGVRYKDAVYFYDYLSTKLYKMDLNDRMISIYGIFEDAASIETALYGNSCIYNNKAWFIPNQATNIALVDVEKQNNIRYFPLKFNIFNEEAYNKTHQRFKQIIKEKNNKIFLIPTCMDTVIEINLETEEFVYHYDIINPQEEIMGYGAVVDNCLWIFPIIGNKGKKLNILSNDIEEFDWNIGNGEYECTIAKGKNIFFSPGSTTSVMELDTETFNMNTYAIPAEYDGGGSTSMARIMDNILWIARDCSNNGVLFFDINKKIYGMKKKNDEKRDWSYLSFIDEMCSDEILLSTNADGCILKINKTGEMKCIESYYDRENVFKSLVEMLNGDYNSVLQNLNTHNSSLNESMLRLEDYLKVIVNSNIGI